MKRRFVSGYVALAGRPNVGKSTLLNRMLGQKLTITSAKPQTTRNQLQGILTGPDYQIIWVDTPGLHKPLHELGEQMVLTARAALETVDLVLWLLDASTGMTAADRKVAEILNDVAAPVWAVWNKADLQSDQTEAPGAPAPAQRVLRVSAAEGQGVDELIAAVVGALPAGPAYFPEDQLTDQSERFVAAEFIREQVLQHTEEEVPHSVAVRVEEMKERPNGKMYIGATIYVERDSQKGILIGTGGAKLKEIGAAARGAIEELLDQPVFLNLWVKVRPKWRNNKTALREFGYWDEGRKGKR